MTATGLGFVHLLERGSSGVTVLALHATGGDEHQLAPLARELAPAATVLAPRGKVLEHGVTRRFFARHSGTDVLVATGSRDPYVEPGAAGKLAGILRAGGAAVTERVVDVGHELTPADFSATRQWLSTRT